MNVFVKVKTQSIRQIQLWHYYSNKRLNNLEYVLVLF
jgi:hypothetical protein